MAVWQFDAADSQDLIFGGNLRVTEAKIEEASILPDIIVAMAPVWSARMCWANRPKLLPNECCKVDGSSAQAAFRARDS